MSDNEELDPDILRALRDVPPASASLKDAHISAALSEISVPQRHSGARFRIVGGIAAAFVLALGGVAVLRDGVDAPNMATNVSSTLPPKTGTTCTDAFSELMSNVSYSQEITHNKQTYALMFRDGAIDMYFSTTPCSLVGTLQYQEAVVARAAENGSTESIDCSTESILHSFSADAAGEKYQLVALQADDSVSVRFADRCDTDIASVNFPTLP